MPLRLVSDIPQCGCTRKFNRNNWFIYLCEHLIYLREITHDVCYLAQPTKGYYNKVATVTEDAASSCLLSQPWMWLLMVFFSLI